MEIRDRLYPYPVLAEFKDDYVDSTFSIQLDAFINKNEIEFKVSYHLTNDSLLDLIFAKKAKVLVHLECPSTSYRKVYEILNTEISIKIPANMLDGILQVCSFIVACEDIPSYKNVDFNEIYENMSFNIFKHNVLAIGTSMKVPIEKDYDEIKNVSSIFAVFPNLNKNEIYVTRDFYQDKIIINIPKKEYDMYKIAIQNPKNHAHMHAMIIIPILTEIIELLKKDGGWDDLEDKKWFMALSKTLRKEEIKFDEDSIKNVNTFNFVQKVMQSPITKSLENLFDQSLLQGGLEDEY